VIDFTLTDEQRALRDVAREFAQKEIVPVALHHDRTGEFPWDVARKAYAVGLLNLTIPAEFGGGGLGYLDTVLVREELAAGCAGINSALGITGLGVLPVLVGGSEEQKRAWLPRVTDGAHFVSYGLTEPDAGSDVAGIKSTARRVGDHYVLNGTKRFITAGTVAEWFTVFAYTDRGAGRNGMSVFWVPRETPGLSVPRKEDVMGQRAGNTAEVLLEEAAVPAANLIGREGDGFRIAMEAFARTRPGVGAAAVGVARAAFEHAFAYAHQRLAFGQPIAGNQAIQFKLAQMALKVDAARLLTWRSARAADQGRRVTKEAAFAKLYAADACMEVTTEAVQILGGVGYSRETPVEKYMRDAKLMQIYEGTSEIQHLIIYRELAREAGLRRPAAHGAVRA
jgi:acyl-CoA dehydrogenase